MIRIRDAFASLIALATLSGVAAAGSLSASASCDGAGNITFTWTFYDSPPTGHPEWVGYDVTRRSLGDCGAFVRLNAVPFARVPGLTDTHTFTEPAPATGTTYEYRLVFVDASRQPVYLDAASCDFCGPASSSWASCPSYSAPLTQGRLQDLGWALYVLPCAGSCYPSGYYDGPRLAELRPYAASGQALLLYGQAFCGGFEGCSIDLDHYELTDCGPTAARSATWGQVKTIYR